MRRGGRKDDGAVMITTYVESTKTQGHPERGRIKPFCNKPHTHGYDRKAQLLAYAKELRTSSLDHPTTASKFKKRRWIRILPSPAKLIRPLFDSRQPWRYERMQSQGNDGLRNSQFCGRVRKLIREWSSACNCKPSV